MTAPVRVEVAGGVARIVLDRPEKRNALSRATRAELAAALDRVAADPEVAVVTLTGSGPVFCAGADLYEPDADREAAPTVADLLRRLMDGPKPVVAVLNGPARAGGVGLVAACDVAIGPDDATFAFSEVRLGLVPAMIAVPCLERMAPRQTARYFLTGETFGAPEAVAIGLLTLAVAPGEVAGRAEEVVEALLLGAPAALAGTKQLLAEVPRLERDRAFATTAALSLRYFNSDDGREGRAAFAAKRPARWVRSGR